MAPKQIAGPRTGTISRRGFRAVLATLFLAVVAGVPCVAQAQDASVEASSSPPDANKGPIRRQEFITTTESVVLNIPDELAPSVSRYMDCRATLAGVEMRRGGKPVRNAVPASGNCDGLREQAAKSGRIALRQAGVRNAHERATRVDKVLDDIDAFLTENTAPTPGGATLVLPPDFGDVLTDYVTCLAQGGATCERQRRDAIDASDARLAAMGVAPEDRQRRIAEALEAIDQFFSRGRKGRGGR